MLYINSREIPMYQFLLLNKKYKYDNFFIDEYNELTDFVVYIEEKILSIVKKKHIIEKAVKKIIFYCNIVICKYIISKL